MSYADLQHLSDSEFKRLCGVSRDTFACMVEGLCPHLEREGRRGEQNKLSTEDQLLITLEYGREYRMSVSHRDKLGTARNYGRTNHQKS
jgi:hypothetical protein